MELSRYCTVSNFSIVGGASKLLKAFRKIWSGSIISFCDIRWNTGEVYEKIGFTRLYNTKENYYYYNEKEPLKLNHRYGFAKHLLKDKLERFDALKTEKQNCEENGYKQIYDCGSIKFEIL